MEYRYRWPIYSEESRVEFDGWNRPHYPMPRMAASYICMERPPMCPTLSFPAPAIREYSRGRRKSIFPTFIPFSPVKGHHQSSSCCDHAYKRHVKASAEQSPRRKKWLKYPTKSPADCQWQNEGKTFLEPPMTDLAREFEPVECTDQRLILENVFRNLDRFETHQNNTYSVQRRAEQTTCQNTCFQYMENPEVYPSRSASASTRASHCLDSLEPRTTFENGIHDSEMLQNKEMDFQQYNSFEQTQDHRNDMDLNNVAGNISDLVPSSNEPESMEGLNLTLFLGENCRLGNTPTEMTENEVEVKLGDFEYSENKDSFDPSNFFESNKHENQVECSEINEMDETTVAVYHLNNLYPPNPYAVGEIAYLDNSTILSQTEMKSNIIPLVSNKEYLEQESGEGNPLENYKTKSVTSGETISSSQNGILKLRNAACEKTPGNINELETIIKPKIISSEEAIKENLLIKDTNVLESYPAIMEEFTNAASVTTSASDNGFLNAKSVLQNDILANQNVSVSEAVSYKEEDKNCGFNLTKTAKESFEIRTEKEGMVRNITNDDYMFQIPVFNISQKGTTEFENFLEKLVNSKILQNEFSFTKMLQSENMSIGAESYSEFPKEPFSDTISSNLTGQCNRKYSKMAVDLPVETQTENHPKSNFSLHNSKLPLSGNQQGTLENSTAILNLNEMIENENDAQLLRNAMDERTELHNSPDAVLSSTDFVYDDVLSTTTNPHQMEATLSSVTNYVLDDPFCNAMLMELGNIFDSDESTDSRDSCQESDEKIFKSSQVSKLKRNLSPEPREKRKRSFNSCKSSPVLKKVTADCNACSRTFDHKPKLRRRRELKRKSELEMKSSSKAMYLDAATQTMSCETSASLRDAETQCDRFVPNDRGLRNLGPDHWDASKKKQSIISTFRHSTDQKRNKMNNSLDEHLHQRKTKNVHSRAKIPIFQRQKRVNSTHPFKFSETKIDRVKAKLKIADKLLTSRIPLLKRTAPQNPLLHTMPPGTILETRTSTRTCQPKSDAVRRKEFFRNRKNGVERKPRSKTKIPFMVRNVNSPKNIAQNNKGKNRTKTNCTETQNNKNMISTASILKPRKLPRNAPKWNLRSCTQNKAHNSKCKQNGWKYELRNSKRKYRYGCYFE